ncbi:MAG: hypothetical protein A2857_00355 [Candidatus Levybacteria bacterium RIFCSPHIGHO2_01_FULL_36_15]|nr:MAG: hypothetical protein A2857_00355 [Candidatus Levybacteria bacterium RIFCSPHIGHO2_01_FULL_36_15]
MKLKTTSKQLEILHLLYKFRFLNRHQIQTLLNHKDYRRIQAWLTDLVKSELVSRNYSREYGENTKPAIYYLNVKSKKYLSNLDGFSSDLLKRVYRERGHSKRFINHCITVGDVYIHLKSLSNDKLIQFLTKEELLQSDHLIQPAPDAYFTVERADKTSYRFFLEVIDPGLPRYVIRKRILDYISYAEGKEWEEKTGHEFPALLCACPNDWVKNYLYRLIKAIQKDEETVNFYLMVYSRSDNKHFWQKVN